MKRKLLLNCSYIIHVRGGFHLLSQFSFNIFASSGVILRLF